MTDPDFKAKVQEMDRIIQECEERYAQSTNEEEPRPPAIPVLVRCTMFASNVLLSTPAWVILLPLWKRCYTWRGAGLALEVAAYARQSKSVRVKLFALEIVKAIPRPPEMSLRRLFPLLIPGVPEDGSDELHAFRYLMICATMFGISRVLGHHRRAAELAGRFREAIYP
jgi:hypothetical protein